MSCFTESHRAVFPHPNQTLRFTSSNGILWKQYWSSPIDGGWHNRKIWTVQITAAAELQTPNSMLPNASGNEQNLSDEHVKDASSPNASSVCAYNRHEFNVFSDHMWFLVMPWFSFSRKWSNFAVQGFELETTVEQNVGREVERFVLRSILDCVSY